MAGALVIRLVQRATNVDFSMVGRLQSHGGGSADPWMMMCWEIQEVIVVGDVGWTTTIVGKLFPP